MLITHRVKFRELPFINCYVKEGDLAIIETQYIKLLDANWSNILSKESNSNIYIFWPDVRNCQDAGGDYLFRLLAEFVLTLLALPSSNAVVERIFSIMSTVKGKLRNKLSIATLESILLIRTNTYT
jgi:hypothetical protein